MKLILISILSISIFNSWIASASSQFNVLDYGAIGNGQADDSQAFLKAWKDVCGARVEDIPTLHVPMGKVFMLNPLKFEGPCNSKQVNFDLQGSVMAPSIDVWVNHGEDNWIQFLDIDGLKISGLGQFDAQGSFWSKHDSQTHHSQLPTALSFNNCNGLGLRETKHINSAKNHISIDASNDVIISNIHIIAPIDSPNTDGIDISRSNNVIIQNSLIETGNDCVALYNGSSNIIIIGLTCASGHGISIGSLGEDSEYFMVEKIHVSNCLLKGAQNSLEIKTSQGGYGFVRDITFENITIIGAQNPIIIHQEYTRFGNARKNKAGHEMGIKVRDVTYREIHGTSSSENAIVLNCSPIRCSNMIMEDVSIMTSTAGKLVGAFCKYVDGKSRSTVPVVPCLSNTYY